MPYKAPNIGRSPILILKLSPEGPSWWYRRRKVSPEEIHQSAKLKAVVDGITFEASQGTTLDSPHGEYSLQCLGIWFDGVEAKPAPAVSGKSLPSFASAAENVEDLNPADYFHLPASQRPHFPTWGVCHEFVRKYCGPCPHDALYKMEEGEYEQNVRHMQSAAKYKELEKYEKFIALGQVHRAHTFYRELIDTGAFIVKEPWKPGKMINPATCTAADERAYIAHWEKEKPMRDAQTAESLKKVKVMMDEYRARDADYALKVDQNMALKEVGLDYDPTYTAN